FLTIAAARRHPSQYWKIVFLSSEDQQLRGKWVLIGNARRKQEASSAKGNNALTTWCQPVMNVPGTRSY
ncbi:hypothetical protein LINPERPRIM_LOCUS21066, partial [Linum perenne]